MGRIIRCAECGELYRELETVEELRDNDGICLVCNAPIEVLDWDRVLSSYEDEDLDDVDAVDEDDEEWTADVEIDDAEEADFDTGTDTDTDTDADEEADEEADDDDADDDEDLEDDD